MRRSVRNSQTSSSQLNYKEQNQIDENKEKDLADAASKLVLYVLHHLDNKKPLRRAIIQKHVAVKGVNWNQQLDAANKRLQGVYGCILEVYDDPSVKQQSYYIKKITPHIDLSDGNEVQGKKLVIFFVLTNVYMSNGKCSVIQLSRWLEKLKLLDMLDDNIKELLKELCANRMIEMNEDIISWGPLADVLVDKMEILKFVSKIYGTNVNSWGELYTNAVDQVEMNRLSRATENINDQEMCEAGTSQKSQQK